MRRHLPSTLILSSLACALAAYAQTSPTSGAIRGVVASKSGGAIAGAKVELRNQETGMSRTLVTDSQGHFVAPLLPPGQYEISINAKGMLPVKDRRITVLLGQTTPLSFGLVPAETGAIVEVVAQASKVDTTQISAQTSISQDVVETIPVNGRNFTDLVLLTPGTGTNAEGYRQTVEGARGIQNNLQIDGMSFNSKFNGEQRGGTRIPNAFGQDTIRELQVITNAFDAQYGDSNGAVINAISKSGTNDFTGSLMALWRPNWGVASIKATPAGGTSQNTPEARKREFDQQNYGFTLGGPIIKDKLHFFVGAELVKDNIGSYPTLTPGDSKSGSTQADMDAFYNTGLGYQMITAADGRTMAQELTQPWTNSRKNTTVFGRLDWTINPNHRLALRLNSQNYKAENNTYSGTRRTDVAWSNNAQHEFKSTSWVMELNSILTSNLLNEARVQISSEDRPSTPNAYGFSEVRVGSSSAAFRAGTYYIEPRTTKEDLTQIQDNLTWMSGAWQIKGGFDYQSIRFKNLFFPNQFGAWSFSNYSLANTWLTNPTGTNPFGTNVTYTQNYSPLGGLSDFKERFLQAYTQVQYSGLMDNRLMVSLGARFTSEKWDDNPNPNPALAGLDRMPDAHSVDPRFGFTYDVMGDNRTVLRGGYGYFTVGNPAQTASGAIMNNAINMRQYQIKGGAAFMAGGLLSAASRFTGGRMTSLTEDQMKTIGTASVQGTLIDPEARMARAEAFNLGVEHDFGNGWTAAARTSIKHMNNLQYFVNINLAQKDATGAVVPGAFYNDGYPTAINSFSVASATRPGKAIVRGRELTLTGFGDVGLSRTDGKGNYHSLVLESGYKAPAGWGFNANITFASAEDNNSNERATAQATVGNVPNPANPLESYAPSDNDRHTRAVLAFWMPKFFGIRVSGVMTYATGLPYTAYYTQDVNGDGISYNDPVFGRNAFRQPSDKTFDLRMSREFVPFPFYRKLRLEGIVDVYNVLNWANQKTSKTGFASNPAQLWNASADFGAIDKQDARTRELQFTLKARF